MTDAGTSSPLTGSVETAQQSACAGRTQSGGLCREDGALADRPGERSADWAARDTLLAAALALVSGVAYVRTLAPGVVAGNSAEYQYVAPILGIPHSTGYPLYILLGKAFTLLPVGSVAYRVNLLSAVAAALAVAAVYALVFRLTGRRMLGAALALVFGFASSFWSAALIAEVHTLNVAFIALDVLLLLRWAARQRTLPRAGVAWSELRMFALVYGLSLAHHRMAILLAPAFAVYIVLILTARRYERQAANVDWRAPLALTVLIFLLPLAFYTYIPIRGGQLLATSDPAVTAIYKDRMPEAILRGTVTANYRGGWVGFVSLVSGSDYATDVGLDSWVQLGERAILWAGTLIAQYSMLGLLLGLLGAVVLCRRDWRTGLLFVLGYLSLVGFALIYVGHGQIWYYFMPSYVFLAGFFGMAADSIWNLLENRRSGRSTEPLVDPYLIYAALWFVLPATLWMQNGPVVDMSQHDVDARRAQDVLRRPLEQGAAMMGPWDLVTSIRYYQYAEGVRPDLVVIHGDPAYSSGKKMIDQAIELKRPFYLLAPVEASMAERSGEWTQVTPIPYYGPVDALGQTHPGAGLGAFGGRVSLQGGRLSPDPVGLDRWKGAAVKVDLYWRTLAAMKRNYKLFAHLIDPTGLIRVQVDESPASVYYPTSRWQPGQVWLDEHWLILPPDAPLGRYTLEVGLTDADTGARLPVSPDPSGDGAAQPDMSVPGGHSGGMPDSVIVGAIDVEIRGSQ
jgi:hypothetical protein